MKNVGFGVVTAATSLCSSAVAFAARDNAPVVIIFAVLIAGFGGIFATICAQE